jgi:hypothetical protein
MPAIASEPPDGISTTVSARRARIEGIVRVWLVPGTPSVIAFSLERSDTSVADLQADAALAQHNRREARLTPNFLKSICCWQTGGDLVVSQDNPFGTGNSPPATNKPVSPDTTVTFGSASVRTTPAAPSPSGLR